MKSKKQIENNINTEILKQASKCKADELEVLLEQVEVKLEMSQSRNSDLLMAKTIITSRLASQKNK